MDTYNMFSVREHCRSFRILAWWTRTNQNKTAIMVDLVCGCIDQYV